MVLAPFPVLVPVMAPVLVLVLALALVLAVAVLSGPVLAMPVAGNSPCPSPTLISNPSPGFLQMDVAPNGKMLACWCESGEPVVGFRVKGRPPDAGRVASNATVTASL